ncbi:MAG: UrcA family protein [Caulobacterales bacterium]|nr:UrcA family protein [Caulobacterales bacterium]
MFTSITPIIASAALAAIAAVPALADDKAAPTVTVDLAGVETVDGAREIYRKLHRDAERACRTSRFARVSLREEMAARQCTQEIVEKAIEKAQRPLLTALHAGGATRLAEYRP